MRDRFASLSAEEAFASTTLLVHTLRLDDWPDWFEAADLHDVIPSHQVPLDDMSLIYQGMLDGMGVGLCQRRYVAQDVADGKLHLLAETVLERERGFYLVCLPETMRGAAVQAFVGWIVRGVGIQ
jgi:LysR family glycine cleavage system transcriptional activator